ncbi:Carboxylesterase-like protein 20 [Elsinoe fawcettii]|nr:Carboxylesterase-like protein 20 [Elsinoe fawcettii]
MHFSRSYVFICAQALLVAAAPASIPSDGLTVRTNAGYVTGFYNSSAPSVRQFLGIPYAQPPTGDLRFAPPQPAQLRSGVLNATTFGPSCMQRASTQKTIYTERVPQFLINGGQSEDCLYLNVWAPETSPSDGGLLPVLVYIPGGGFTSGGANSVYKFPDQWIQRTQSHLVVIINYRVNVFGFPNAAGLADANVGLLDQRLAVEWTRDNIAAFGGDPSRITLWGQSAGAASSNVYAYAYPEDPIINAFISDSGSATIAGSQDYTHTNFTSLARLVNCTSSDPASELACMRTVPADLLESTYSRYNSTPGLTFTPLYDNKTAFQNTTDRALRGLVAKIPGIIGSNTNEGAGFVAFTESGPGDTALKAATQNTIACPVAAEVKNRQLAGLSTYRYQYAGNFTNVSPVSWFGAYHSSELPLLFGTHFQYRGQSTFFEYQVSHFMEELWLSLVANPAAGPKIANGFVWPLYNASADTMVQFANGTTKVQLVSGQIIDGDCPNL